LNSLNDLIGLTNEKRKARIAISACKVTGETFPHTLITSIGGLGKTTLCRAIANELGSFFVEREAFSLRNPEQISDLLITSNRDANAAKKKLFLFLDEVHRLTLKMQEVFYYPMKEWKICTRSGYRSINHFTLVAATTRKDMLDDASFVQRFENQWEIKRYSVTDICSIIRKLFIKENISADEYVIRLVAERCLGVPRQASNLAIKMRNYVLSQNRRNLTADDVNNVCNIEHIDKIGLSEIHQRYLYELRNSSVPKGIKSIAGKLSLHEDTVVGTIEPILLSLGFIDICKGRILTEAGKKHLGIT